MIKLKNNRQKARKQLALEDSGYQLEYCSPDKYCRVLPPKPLDYGLVHTDPEQLFSDFHTQKVQTIVVKNK